MYLPPFLLLWPLMRWMRRLITKATLTGDRLRYETGALTRSERTIQLSKVQDVRVEQRIAQRIFGVGKYFDRDRGRSQPPHPLRY